MNIIDIALWESKMRTWLNGELQQSINIFVFITVWACPPTFRLTLYIYLWKTCKNFGTDIRGSCVGIFFVNNFYEYKRMYFYINGVIFTCNQFFIGMQLVNCLFCNTARAIHSSSSSKCFHRVCSFRCGIRVGFTARSLKGFNFSITQNHVSSTLHKNSFLFQQLLQTSNFVFLY